MLAQNNSALMDALSSFEANLQSYSLDRSETIAEQILDRFEEYESEIEPWLEFRLEAEEERREAHEEAAGLAEDIFEELAGHYEELEGMRTELQEDGADSGFTQEGLDASEAYLDYLSDLLTSTVAAGALNEDSPIIGMIDDNFSFEEGSRGNDDVKGSGRSDFILGLGGADDINGRGGADRIDGGRGSDDLNGGRGADVLLGAAGNDDLHGKHGADNLDGGAGRDMLLGGVGNDVLIGGGGRDKLYGGRGNDDLTGGGGRDILYGDKGANVMSGGDGGDVFVFKRGWDGDSAITDYDSGEGDRLRLNGVRIEEVDHEGGEAIIELSNGGTITVSGSDLSDFLF